MNRSQARGAALDRPVAGCPRRDGRGRVPLARGRARPAGRGRGRPLVATP